MATAAPPGATAAAVLSRAPEPLCDDAGAAVALIVAVQNQAGHVMLQKLLQSGWPEDQLLVVGSEFNDRMSDEQTQLTAESQAERFPSVMAADQDYRQALEAKVEINTLKRLAKTYLRLKKECKARVLARTRVALTTVENVHKLITSRMYACVSLRITSIIVDEAGTVPEYHLPLLAHLNPQRIIFFGDKCQLPPSHTCM